MATEPVTFGVDGGTCAGLLAEGAVTAAGPAAASVVPVSGRAPGRPPGVVLIHEWWGVNDHIRSLCERLAAAGFVALAPDLYHGRVTRDATEAAAWMGALDWEQALGDLDGAARFLATHPRANGRVGAIGFCMGGALAFAAAARVPALAAVAPFYGVPAPARFDPTRDRLHAAIQAHFGRSDGWATPAVGASLKRRIEEAGGRIELHLYDAGHAFVNDTRPEAYVPSAARVAWERAMAFLHAELG